MLKNSKAIDDGLTKEERKQKIKELKKAIFGKLQAFKSANVPVIVLVEGWSCSGKGTLINQMISEIDPRFFHVFTYENGQKEADRYPFLYPYWETIPENGKFVFMDGGWMEGTIRGMMIGEPYIDDLVAHIESVRRFERTLKNNGYRIVKLFVDVDEKAQKKRIKKLFEHKDTSWRVTPYDVYQNDHYKKFRDAYDRFMEADNDIPWHVLKSDDKKELVLAALNILNDTMDSILTEGRYDGPAYDEYFPLVENCCLENCDMKASLSYEDYKAELKILQKSISELHNVLYRKKIPVVCAFEGWDAAGKGGAIRRLATPLDPRGFEVIPVASPTAPEKNRHYLWRFWTKMPRTGHVTIFDRTWYGRVMVERLEGFCSENDWQRAFNEMNEFEEDLVNSGAVVLKFWVNVDKDTQLARFTERQNTPEKNWKITDEDWRNREKWDLYWGAINDMLKHTSTEFAPWHIIESNDKLYARIKVLRIVEKALREAIGE